ncbi:MAG: hypothetical protein QM728_01730 [Gordonia sp. (in: high G+C Gram-positive bacteria)]|uniref:hypothetical protein n=1 Tax=Gordonia sp. (in: high G+C Gram-positive bacteria) TaxID=84139 RepID=UPI0039E22D42
MTRFSLGLLAAVVAVLVGLLSGCGSSESSGPVGDIALPGDFPSKQVPLIDGRVIAATGTKADGWSVTMQGEYGGPNVLDAAIEKLTKSGYSESSRTEEGGTRTVILSKKDKKETLWVTVGSSPNAAGGPNSVFYQVNLS